MGSTLFGPAVQLRWDDRVVVPLDFAWVSITIPASFADLVVWWRFKDAIAQWAHDPAQERLAQLDPLWLTCLPGRETPEQIMLSAFPDALEDDGHRLRLALHHVAIALDDH